MKVRKWQLYSQAGLVCILFNIIFLAGCHNSGSSSGGGSTPPPGSASIVPGVNPAFDSISEIATSIDADGPFLPAAEGAASYDPATETVSLVDGTVPAEGLYVRITGTATVGGVASSYTIYTYVDHTTPAVAANELTSIAVGIVAEGNFGIAVGLTDEGDTASFGDAIATIVSWNEGLTAAAITAPDMAADRDPTLTALMIALADSFKNGDFQPGVTSAQTISDKIEQCLELGGVAWDNWTKLNAGGTDALPSGETSSDYVRCKACHGWDQLGTDGGYARRSRKSSRPNAGFGDPNTVSRNISTGLGDHPPISIDDIFKSGRSWAEGSAAFDSTDPWGTGAQKGNEHPDLSPTGTNSPDTPTVEQLVCLTAFLNYPEARENKVFAIVDTNSGAEDPVPAWCTSSQCSEYTLVASADAANGESWYNDTAGGNCVTCHGQPEDETGPIATGPTGGLLAFLRQDGKYSEFRHKVQWGEAGNDVMSRANMNQPTAAEVADVLAYLQGKIEAPVDVACVAQGGLAWDNWTKLNAGGTDALPSGETSSDYVRCKACHGWDQLGTDGGYARRSRKSSRPNAGFGDPNTVSRNVSNDVLFGNAGSISPAMVLHAGTGRSWTDGSAAFDSTDPWGTGAQKGNEHPDLSSGGVNGTDVPAAEQIACLTEFLNYPEARIDQVFSAIDTDPVDTPEWCTSGQCSDYTLVATADADRGEAWYNDTAGGNCLSCHGQPEDATGPIATGPAGGLLVFLRQDGKFSEFRHKVQWGESGNDLMSRTNMNEPTAAEVADVLAYLRARIDVQLGQPTAANDADTTSVDTAVIIDVLANDSDPNEIALTVISYDAVSANGGTASCTVDGSCTYTPATSFTGSDSFNYTISNGTSQASATVTVVVSGPSGSIASGQAKWDATCSVCHSATPYDNTLVIATTDLARRGSTLVEAGLMINNLVETNATMTGQNLTDQEILDMVAFLDSL